MIETEKTNFRTFVDSGAEMSLMHQRAFQNLKDKPKKKVKRKVQGVPQSQTAVLPRPQEEEETDKSKQAQIE